MRLIAHDGAAAAESCHGSPIGRDEVEGLLSGLLAEAGRTALAVSGGADSMALMRLVAVYARERFDRLSVLTVDHGLRPEAADEARQVKAWSEALGLECDVISLRLSPGTDAATARRARYEALTDRTGEGGTLVTAHHLDDQAETMLMNLARGSGLRGLAGMPAGRVFNGIYIHRPFLRVPGGRLRATCRAFEQDWIEDPSNRDVHQRRIAVRERMSRLQEIGIDREGLAGVAEALQGSRRLLDRLVAAALSEAVVSDMGLVGLPGKLVSEDVEVARRALGGVLAAVGGREHAPGGAELDDLLEWLSRGQSPRRTLHGCVITRATRETLTTVHREPGRADLPTWTLVADDAPLHCLKWRYGSHTGSYQPALEWRTWDGRFRFIASERVVIGPYLGPPLRLADRQQFATDRAVQEAVATAPAWWDGTEWHPFVNRSFCRCRRWPNLPARLQTNYVVERMTTLKQAWPATKWLSLPTPA